MLGQHVITPREMGKLQLQPPKGRTELPPFRVKGLSCCLSRTGCHPGDCYIRTSVCIAVSHYCCPCQPRLDPYLVLSSMVSPQRSNKVTAMSTTPCTFHHRDVVWAQCHNWPWWPGRIETPDRVKPDKNGKLVDVKEGQALVVFFNFNEEHAVVPIDKLRPFTSTYADELNAKHKDGASMREGLRGAIKEAEQYSMANQGAGGQIASGSGRKRVREECKASSSHTRVNDPNTRTRVKSTEHNRFGVIQPGNVVESPARNIGRCAEDRSKVKAAIQKTGKGMPLIDDVDEWVPHTTAKCSTRLLVKLKSTKVRVGNRKGRKVVEVEQLPRSRGENLQHGICHIQAKRSDSRTADRDEEADEGSGSEGCLEEDMYQALSSCNMVVLDEISQRLKRLESRIDSLVHVVSQLAKK